MTDIRCPRCDAAIALERLGPDRYVSFCCGIPFRVERLDAPARPPGPAPVVVGTLH